MFIILHVYFLHVYFCMFIAFVMYVTKKPVAVVHICLSVVVRCLIVQFRCGGCSVAPSGGEAVVFLIVGGRVRMGGAVGQTC